MGKIKGRNGRGRNQALLDALFPDPNKATNTGTTLVQDEGLSLVRTVNSEPVYNYDPNRRAPIRAALRTLLMVWEGATESRRRTFMIKELTRRLRKVNKAAMDKVQRETLNLNEGDSSDEI